MKNQSVFAISLCICIVFLCLCSSASLGTIIKCISPSGKVVYSNSTCPQGYTVKSSFPESKSQHSFSSNAVSTLVFDGFNWQIKRTHRFQFVGQKRYFKRPQNDYFFVVEATVENVSSEPRYITDNMKLIAGNNQYEYSTTAEVYSKYQLGYESQDEEIEPGVRANIFFGFDVKAANNFTLIISEWGFGDNRIKLNIH